MIFSTRIKNWLKRNKQKLIKSFRIKNRLTSDSDNQIFNNLFQKFSMEDFYLENQALDKSMDLFAICKKDTQNKRNKKFIKE